MEDAARLKVLEMIEEKDPRFQCVIKVDRSFVGKNN